MRSEVKADIGERKHGHRNKNTQIPPVLPGDDFARSSCHHQQEKGAVHDGRDHPAQMHGQEHGYAPGQPDDHQAK